MSSAATLNTVCLMKLWRQEGNLEAQLTQLAEQRQQKICTDLQAILSALSERQAQFEKEVDSLLGRVVALDKETLAPLQKRGEELASQPIQFQAMLAEMEAALKRGFDELKRQRSVKAAVTADAELMRQTLLSCPSKAPSHVLSQAIDEGSRKITNAIRRST